MRFARLLFVSSLISCTAAGVIGTAGESCGDQGPCQAGSVCLEGVCVEICTSDRHCTLRGTICDGDICVVGDRTDVPTIVGVNGDSAADPSPGHTNHHVHNRMTIEGENLTGVAVSLTAGGVDHELEVCNAGEREVEVELPTGLDPGEYVLTVATAAGSCDALLPVLQGEPGTEGPVGPRGNTGVKGDTGPVGPKGETGTAGPKGDAGPRGDKGDNGSTGAVGPKGSTGSTGATGPRGYTGNTGAAGPKGDTGAGGPAGPQGPAGVGSQGPQGPQGPQGVPGVPGAITCPCGTCWNVQNSSTGCGSGCTPKRRLCTPADWKDMTTCQTSSCGH